MVRVGLGRVGSQNFPSFVGRVGSGPVSKISNKYTIYTQEIDYSTTIIHHDIATYYRLIIYSNIKIVLFGQKAVARETMMLESEFKKSSDGQAEGFGS